MTTITTPAALPRRDGASALATARAFLRRSVRQSVRDGEGLVMAVALPVMLMLLFTTVFGGAIDADGGYTTYVVPGIILLCAGFGASSVAVAVSRDITSGAMTRYRTLPIASPLVLFGHVAASVLRNLLATAVVIGVGVAIGFRPTADPLEWVAAIGLVALYVLAITSLFAVIGLVAGSPENANGYGFILLFLPYVSSAFVPVETMPTWMHGFAEHQPITPITETLRSLLTGTNTAAWPASLGWCVGAVAVAALLMAILLPRRLRK